MEKIAAEAIGTMLLVLLGDGVVANVLLARSKGQNSGWIVITMGWGVAVALAIYAVGRISGAHLNPAVTVGLASIGSFPWPDVPGYIVAQVVGAFVGRRSFGWLICRTGRRPPTRTPNSVSLRPAGESEILPPTSSPRSSVPLCWSLAFWRSPRMHRRWPAQAYRSVRRVHRCPPAAARRDPRARNRTFARRTDRLRD